jgi:hypothetical protein
MPHIANFDAIAIRTKRTTKHHFSVERNSICEKKNFMTNTLITAPFPADTVSAYFQYSLMMSLGHQLEA